MAKASVAITAANKLSDGLGSAKKQMDQFQQYMSGLGNKIQSAFSIAAIATTAVVAIKKIAAEMKECVAAFEQADKVTQRMNAVWLNVGKATGYSSKEMANYAEAIEKVTFFSGESVKEAGLLLAATESLTEEGFDRALDASLDLAAALGEDVPAAAQTLAKAMEDPEASLNRLKSIGVTFTEEEKNLIKTLSAENKEFEAQDLILAKVEERYKGVAKAINQTPTGTLDNIRDVMTDLKEDIGAYLTTSLGSFFTWLYNKLTALERWLNERTEKKQYEANLQAGNATWLAMNTTPEKLAADLVANNALLDQAISSYFLTGLNNFGDALSSVYVDWAALMSKSSDEIIKQMTSEGILNRNQAASFADAFMYYKDMLLPFFSQSDTLREAIRIQNSQVPTYDSTEDGSAASTVVKTVEDTVKTIINWIDSYGSSSSSYLKQQYETVISEAEGYIKQITDTQNIVKSTGGPAVNEAIDALREALGLTKDVSFAEILAMVPHLQEIVVSYQDKIDKLIPAVEDSVLEPTALEKILEQYGKYSATLENEKLIKTIAEIQKVYETADESQREILEEILTELKIKLPEPEYPEGLHPGSESGVPASIQAAGDGIWNMITGMGEFGSLVNELTTNMVNMGPILGSVVTALEYVINGLYEVAGPALDFLTQTLLQPLIEIGKILGSVINPTLQILAPILQIIETPLLVLSATIQWVSQGIQSLIARLLNWMASLNIMGWQPFAGLRTTDPGMPGNLGSYINDYISGTSSASVGTSTAVSSAAYRGATSVTINIYQMSPVVGDNGMRDFARMIRDEFDALDYYGVSA